MKRKQELQPVILNKKQKILDKEFIDSCNNNFYSNNLNLIVKNVITNVGSFHASINHEESTKISHVFLNSIKKKNLKATNQGASGRCWIFSGLNMFRHNVINGLNLENFEFSETYLFFWDKFERSNSYLEWIDEIVYKDSLHINNNDNLFKYLIDKDKWMGDGGFWSYFANLVEKYGLIPKSAMPETYQSEYSEDMNDVLLDILHSATAQLSKIKKNKINQRNNIKNDTLKSIYNTLIKFLGEPPKTFRWDFTTDEGVSESIDNLTPFSFKTLVLSDISLKDFVVLSNIPEKKNTYYKKYCINKSTNVLEGQECEIINLPINELKKFTKKSLLSGLPVWFAGDIRKDFNPILSSLDDKLNDSKILFEKTYNMTKEERIFFLNQQTCHAMTFTGVNLDKKNNTVSWQVENSWGFYDNEIPGMDGFLYMSDKWFDEYVGQVVIHKKMLSRKILNILNSNNVIRIEPWESFAPALTINPIKNLRYKKYLFNKLKI